MRRVRWKAEPPRGCTLNSADDNLSSALARHAIELPAPQIAMLERYCELLWDWNSKLNLTRHTDYEKFVARDLVDSLAIAKFLEPKEKVLDVGTGGGVPGVVLAIVRDDLRVSLSESVGKKARAVADIVERLALPVPVLHARAEDILIGQRFDTLVVRAVARLKKLLEWFQPHWGAFDRLLILKGPSWVEERGEARHYGLMHELALRKLATYPLPGSESESVLLQIRRKQPDAAAK
jgi:16S rRNA (guanine527-N7)-methyltransferase